MKHLIVYAHPNPKSFCKGIVDSVVKTAEEKGHEVKLRDLYTLEFCPLLKPKDFESFQRGEIPSDINEEQQHIKWADLITFVYPVWWTGMPAILKGYIDRVFSYGFAYQYTEKGPEGLLTGKKVLIFNTQGNPMEVYEANGMHDAMKKTSDMGIFNFSGMEMVNHIFYGSVPTVDDATRQNYLKQTEEVIRSI